MNSLSAWAISISALCAGSLVAAQPATSDPTPLIIALPVQQPKIEFVVINTERADYLQSEFSGLANGSGVVVDSISIRSQERGTYELAVRMEVHWRWAQSGRDSIFPLVRRVQFLDSLKVPTMYAPVGAIVRMVAKVDTIWTCNDGKCQIAQTPKVLQNYEPRRAVCALACEEGDSATVAQRIRERLGRTKTALALSPDAKERALVRGVWTRTTGEERLVGICERVPGNLFNWMARDQATFQISGIASDPAGKMALPWSVSYSTGPLQYVYNRTANPMLMILEGSGPRVVNDTLVKHGRTLYLSGNTKRACGRVFDDSAVVRDSWLVIPDSGSVEAIESALSPEFCGNRTSAWRLSGDTVWLGGYRWPVPLRDLVGTSSLGPFKPAVASASLPGLVGSLLTLPFDAQVVARDPSGRRLGVGVSLPNGVHRMDLAGHRGVFLLEIRSLDGRVTRVLRGTTIDR